MKRVEIENKTDFSQFYFQNYNFQLTEKPLVEFFSEKERRKIPLDE